MENGSQCSNSSVDGSDLSFSDVESLTNTLIKSEETLKLAEAEYEMLKALVRPEEAEEVDVRCLFLSNLFTPHNPQRSLENFDENRESSQRRMVNETYMEDIATVLTEMNRDSIKVAIRNSAMQHYELDQKFKLSEQFLRKQENYVQWLRTQKEKLVSNMERRREEREMFQLQSKTEMN